ncbi:hypothetical protein ACFY9F_23150 [Streptomyces sp. NPDC012421]|uniref:hypothetical protein n=1 Tax=unclassified Streptomyces TaxID=2593676 RepID=UPI0036B5697C
MRATVKRVATTLAAGVAVAVMSTAGVASAAPAAPAPAVLTPAGAQGWEYIGEFSRSECISLRDSYAGSAKCVRNAGGLYDLYVLT